MYDATKTIEHNVSIVSVLDLEQERQDAVSGHAHNEVTTCLGRERNTKNQKSIHRVYITGASGRLTDKFTNITFIH